MKKIIILVVLVLCALVLSACGNSTESIVGVWEHKAGYTYTFNKDQTGSYSFKNLKFEFTYEDKEDNVEIKYKNATRATSYEYKIKGNKLIIKDSFGNNIEYTKKK